MGFFYELYKIFDIYSLTFPLRYKKEKEFKTNLGQFLELFHLYYL